MKNVLFTAFLSALLVPAVAARAEAPVCGDVNDNGSINTTDALLVLKKGVGQPIDLVCTAYDEQYEACQGELDQCMGAPRCGNGLVEDGEDCDLGDPGKDDCESLGFEAGVLSCLPGCTYDTIGCYETRFESLDNTIVDRRTGLEWEKKQGGDDIVNLSDPHDVDNAYTWSATAPAANGTVFTDFLAALNGVSNGECFEHHCDWRLPTTRELESIVEPDCEVPPCVVDPVLLPTRLSPSWSNETYDANPLIAWYVRFDNGNTSANNKVMAFAVRAVRGARVDW